MIEHIDNLLYQLEKTADKFRYDLDSNADYIALCEEVTRIQFEGVKPSGLWCRLVIAKIADLLLEVVN
jgi:hypothetical protein